MKSVVTMMIDDLKQRELERDQEDSLTDKNPPLAPHALQTAVTKRLERLLRQASSPVESTRRYFAREELAELISALHIEDLPEETTHAVAFRRFTHQPQKWKIWGAYLTTGD